VPAELYTVPIGRARVLAPGADVTIVGVSYMAHEALRARALLESAGVSAEVIDPVWLSPLDIDTIEASVRRTGRLVVVDCGWVNCGAGAEIVARLAERGAAGRVRRLGFEPVVCPTTKPLEDLFYPTPRSIASEAYALVHAAGADAWAPGAETAQPLADFKGPF
jgi:pyruvate/2-oxoglutarate/acetoin dehydrogenase E1 component